MKKPKKIVLFRRFVTSRKRITQKTAEEVKALLPVIEQQTVKGFKAIKWNKVSAYACVLFGAGGALLPFVPEHWRVFIVAFAGQIQSYLPPVQTYNQAHSQTD